MKIGVFDSGKGGAAVSAALETLIGDAVITTIDDHANMPYGSKTPEEVQQLTDAAIQPLLDGTYDAIVIACNTATTVAIAWLRVRYPTQHFVGIEPMIKPAAAATRTHVVGVLATPATLQSKRYAELKRDSAANITVIEPDCSSWAESIEQGQEDTLEIEATLDALLDQRADVVVLACTHYHWLKPRIQAYVGNDVIVLEPSDAIKNRIVSLVES